MLYIIQTPKRLVDFAFMLKLIFDDFDGENRESLQFQLQSFSSPKFQQKVHYQIQNQNHQQLGHNDDENLVKTNKKPEVKYINIKDEVEQFENTDLDAYFQSLANNQMKNENNQNFNNNKEESEVKENEFGYNFIKQNVIRENLKPNKTNITPKSMNLNNDGYNFKQEFVESKHKNKLDNKQNNQKVNSTFHTPSNSNLNSNTNLKYDYIANEKPFYNKNELTSEKDGRNSKFFKNDNHKHVYEMEELDNDKHDKKMNQNKTPTNNPNNIGNQTKTPSFIDDGNSKIKIKQIINESTISNLSNIEKDSQFRPKQSQVSQKQMSEDVTDFKKYNQSYNNKTPTKNKETSLDESEVLRTKEVQEIKKKTKSTSPAPTQNAYNDMSPTSKHANQNIYSKREKSEIYLFRGIPNSTHVEFCLGKEKIYHLIKPTNTLLYIDMPTKTISKCKYSIEYTKNSILKNKLQQSTPHHNNDRYERDQNDDNPFNTTISKIPSSKSLLDKSTVKNKYF